MHLVPVEGVAYPLPVHRLPDGVRLTTNCAFRHETQILDQNQGY